jgi:DNA-binding CsgD family transcriptional regulator
VNDDLGLSPSYPGGNVRREGFDAPALWFAQDALARLVVTRDLLVLAVNRQAAALLERVGPLSLRDGVLVARDRKAAGELAALVADAARPARSAVIGAEGGAAMLIEAAALGEAPTGPVGLVLRNPNAAVEIECAELEAMFGVTPGEHQVLVQLLKGYSSGEIAEQFGKSILTVRTHVKRAYGKIGVKTRGQLFARLLPFLTIR